MYIHGGCRQDMSRQHSRLWVYNVRSCAFSAHHAALNAAFSRQSLELLQAACYGQSVLLDMPPFMSIVVSTPTVAMALRMHVHEVLTLVIPPPSSASMSCAAMRRSPAFHTMQQVSVVVAGIVPLRDRLGRHTHRAVLRVQL